MLLLDDAMEGHDVWVVGETPVEVDLLTLECVPSCALLRLDDALDGIFCW